MVDSGCRAFAYGTWFLYMSPMRERTVLAYIAGGSKPCLWESEKK